MVLTKKWPSVDIGTWQERKELFKVLSNFLMGENCEKAKFLTKMWVSAILLKKKLMKKDHAVRENSQIFVT